MVLVVDSVVQIDTNYIMAYYTIICNVRFININFHNMQVRIYNIVVVETSDKQFSIILSSKV